MCLAVSRTAERRIHSAEHPYQRRKLCKREWQGTNDPTRAMGKGEDSLWRGEEGKYTRKRVK